MMRPSLKVKDAFLIGRYAEIVEKGGVDFLEAHGTIIGFGSVFVGGAHHLARTHAAARK